MPLPRRRIQFWRLDRDERRKALGTIFAELEVERLADRKAVMRQVEQISYAHHHRLKPAYSNISRDDAKRMHGHLAALAALDRDPLRRSEYEAQAKRYKAMARAPRSIKGKRKDGLHLIIGGLAPLYTERTGKPPGRSTSLNGAATGPFLRVVSAVCCLIDLDKTPDAIATAIKDMDMGKPHPQKR